MRLIVRDGGPLAPPDRIDAIFEPFTPLGADRTDSERGSGLGLSIVRAVRLRSADTTLLGRVSFQLFNSFWPEVAKDPTSPQWTDEQRELSQAGAGVPSIVVSDTLTGTWPNVRIIRRADAHQQIAELKRQAGKDILITGSRTLWNDLLAYNLIDEIHLMIGNVVLGEGIPIFVGKPPASLRLVEVRSWRDSDNILVRYEVRHTGV